MMKNRLRLLAQLLRCIADDCERIAQDKEPLYNSYITEDQIDQIIEDLSVSNNDRLSKYQACRELNISRASFDRKIRAGVFPKGKKVAGWKELSWSKKELSNIMLTLNSSK